MPGKVAEKSSSLLIWFWPSKDLVGCSKSINKHQNTCLTFDRRAEIIPTQFHRRFDILPEIPQTVFK
jgi:hypothetical protein